MQGLLSSSDHSCRSGSALDSTTLELEEKRLDDHLVLRQLTNIESKCYGIEKLASLRWIAKDLQISKTTVLKLTQSKQEMRL